MLRLNERQRRTLGDQLPDAANAAVAALVFGQYVAGQAVSLRAVICGVAVWVLLMACALVLDGGTRS